MSPIRWLPWTADVFARARAEQKPVLLSIAARWCRHCAWMDRTSYDDQQVASLVSARFVPVRVDADRRPDIAQRYGLGGWPTTAFLTPDGAILGGGTHVDPPRMVHVLGRVADAFQNGGALAPHGQAPAPIEDAGTPTTDELIRGIAAAYDPAHGGFGGEPKFPHAAPVRLALDLYTDSGAEEWRDIALTSLDAMGWGPLYDERAGGFFRCSQDRDWGAPAGEKLLDVNALLLSLYVHAFDTLQLARYAERAEDVLRYLQTALADPVDGGWAGSQSAGDSGDDDPQARGGDPTGAAAIDRTLFADWNATMASAALHAGRVMQDAALSEFAIKSFERVVALCYRPGAGVAHYFDESAEARGLLDDQIAMGHASLDAFEATGNIVYEMMAEELALFAVRTMWDERGGGFFDRAPCADDVGLLRTPVKGFVGNCLAGRLLGRLAGTSSSATFRGYADRTFAAMLSRAASEGPLAAEYVLGVRAAQR